MTGSKDTQRSRPLRDQRTSGYGFGTLQGVYTPTLLTILGVIMYLRVGWVLGNVGLAKTLLIVTMSTAITFVTSLSIAALATNMQVGGGGAYYIISRSLGVEAGAAIGLPLFLAYALGVSFYITGFAESVVSLEPSLSPQAVGVATLAILTRVALQSADLALKTQCIILGLVLASLVSFFLGRPVETLTATVGQPLPASQPFWEVFAVFFPAVTGILAGLALSGDLKDPAKSLPLGTIAAIVTSYAIYMVIPVFLSRMVPAPGVLRANALVLRNVARWGDLILYGIWGATLSSAMGSLLGAPRMKRRGIQALVKVQTAPDTLSGAQTLVETYGFGPIVPNTLLLGETERVENFLAYAELLLRVYATRRNLIIVLKGTSRRCGRRRPVWKSGGGVNGTTRG